MIDITIVEGNWGSGRVKDESLWVTSITQFETQKDRHKRLSFLFCGSSVSKPDHDGLSGNNEGKKWRKHGIL